MVYIDAGGRLYRGFGRCYPAIVWHPEETRWTLCDLATPQDWDWGGLVTMREAERCYPGSTKVPAPAGLETVADLSGEELIRFRPELFDDYDGPIYRESPQEETEGMAYFYELAPWARDWVTQNPADS